MLKFSKFLQWVKFPPEDPETLYVYLTTAQMSLVGILVVVYLVNFLRFQSIIKRFVTLFPRGTNYMLNIRQELARP